jgi:hypothetical protein
VKLLKIEKYWLKFMHIKKKTSLGSDENLSITLRVSFFYRTVLLILYILLRFSNLLNKLFSSFICV